MDGPVRDNAPKVGPTKSQELPPQAKPEKPQLSRQDKLTGDLADDFFGGLAEMFEKPATIQERVEYTHYDPTLPVSSNFAEKVINSLANLPLSYEKIGVLTRSEDGLLGFHELKDKTDVDEHKRVQEGDILLKHVGNAIRIIISQSHRESLGKEGVRALKEEASRLFSSKEQPNIPVDVTTLKAEDWQTKVPRFFNTLADVMPAQVKQSQTEMKSQPAGLSINKEASGTRSQAASTSSKKAKTEKMPTVQTNEAFPKTSTDKISKLEEKFRAHDWQIKQAKMQIEAEGMRKKTLDDKR